MTWAPKRFWKEVAVAPEGQGWKVLLDGRPVRTPGKALLVLPSRALAEKVAAEWAAQAGQIRPDFMPATRLANTAQEKVAAVLPAVAGHLAGYGGTDLLCYRAEGPAALVARQSAAWDPPLAWAAETLQAPLAVTRGIVHVAQPAESLARLQAALMALDPFRLSALHEMVTLSGSLILGLAVARGRLAPEEAWALSRIDEDWQIEQWGEDAEAAEAAARRRAAFIGAAGFFALCG